MVDPEVRSAFVVGLDAVRLAAATVDDWSAPTGCDRWRAVDLAGHLVLVVQMYDDLLTRAGGSSAPVPMTTGPALTDKNLRELRELPVSTGPQRIGAFLDTAGSYLRRAEGAADLRWRREDHVLTVGEHLAVAAIEWHLHAWDLGPDRPAPDCAHLLVEAWRSHLPYPIGDGDPWPALLRASGRTP